MLAEEHLCRAEVSLLACRVSLKGLYKACSPWESTMSMVSAPLPAHTLCVSSVGSTDEYQHMGEPTLDAAQKQ